MTYRMEMCITNHLIDIGGITISAECFRSAEYHPKRKKLKGYQKKN